jgi:hypothetical protein
LGIHAAAFVLKNGKYYGSYAVASISVGGIKLIGHAPIEREESVEVLLQLRGYPSLRILARGVLCSGPVQLEYVIGLAFEAPAPLVKKILESVVSDLKRKKNTS